MVYAFDVLEYNGVNLIQHPLIERRTKIPHKSILKESESKIIKYPEEEAKIFEYLQAVMERKYEGLILKGTQDLYFSNGSRVHWGKLKRGFNRGKTDNLDRIELDLVVMGGYHSKQRSINLNSFLVGVRHEGKIYPISKVGSGFSVESYE